MLCQPTDQRFVRPGLNETDYLTETLATEPGAILGRQLSRERRDNWFFTFGSHLAKDIAVNPDANLSIHHHEFCVYALFHANARRFDDWPHITDEPFDPFFRSGDVQPSRLFRPRHRASE